MLGAVIPRSSPVGHLTLASSSRAFWTCPGFAVPGWLQQASPTVNWQRRRPLHVIKDTPGQPAFEWRVRDFESLSMQVSGPRPMPETAWAGENDSRPECIDAVCSAYIVQAVQQTSTLPAPFYCTCQASAPLRRRHGQNW